jgi:hypothetical protein
LGPKSWAIRLKPGDGPAKRVERLWTLAGQRRKLGCVSVSHDDGRRAGPEEIDPLANHWDLVYGGRSATGVSWYQAHPAMSIRMIEALGPSQDDPVIDIGGGASHLAGQLLARDFRDVTVLDLSPAALREARSLLGGDAHRVHWIEHDLLTWRAYRRYGVWHDRAVFHFLVDAERRARYRQVLRSAIRPGGGVVVATFAADGPESCSGLPVARYDTEELVAAIGEGLVVAAEREEHRTPAGVIQPFTWVALRL